MKWQINKIQYPVYNQGQDKRLGIWVQGCSLHCKACINQPLWATDGGECVDVHNLFNWLLLNAEAFDGITITGGEPFEQYDQLIEFLHLVKTNTRLNVCCFSGYYLHELYAKHPDKLFSKYIDYLIDGRYSEKMDEKEGMSGFSSQTTYKFINEIPYLDESFKFSTKWSLKVDDDCKINMSGIPKIGEIEKLCYELDEMEAHKAFN